jgi:tetratricopeptide (TPR) repeat protein
MSEPNLHRSARVHTYFDGGQTEALYSVNWGNMKALRMMGRIPEKARLILFILPILVSCRIKNKSISPEDIRAMNLKRGDVVQCGSPDKHFGSIRFDVSCSDKVRDDFNLAVALLHSFEYEEAEKVFAKIIHNEPGCAMAYWGVAMSNFHPLWTPSTPAELEKGAKAIKIARSFTEISERESGYIEAIAAYYADWDKVNDYARSVHFEKAMEMIYLKYPQDKEAAIFYALALDAAADPTDKSYVNQRKAGTILNGIYPGEPDHPGIVHYIIHTYDYPGLAELALPAARKYASIAPASSHALHMPSHIFTRLGLWDESIQSNLASTAAAKCYAENASIKGHWDEELHGMDYLEYAYLQKGDDELAKGQWDYLRTIDAVYPEDFKVAYAFAAIPSRYLLENKMWKFAAHLEIRPVAFPWEKFPWQKAIFHFTRLLGDAHTGNMDSAQAELKQLKIIHDTLLQNNDLYKANQVGIQIKASEAWILFAEGKKDKALDLLTAAADMEDATEKNPVTPGEVIPTRELLGDMLMQLNDPAKALEAYQEDLKTHPNRFNGLYGAGLSAEKSGSSDEARFYYQQLSAISSKHSSRPELAHARHYLESKRNKTL